MIFSKFDRIKNNFEMESDIRWQQRYSNFLKAYKQLEDAVDMEDYSDLEREGMIQRFEYTYELAWNTMKDYLEDQGFQNITGSKDAIRQAFQVGLIKDAEGWLEMIESRKLSTHTYDEETAVKIAEKIKADYFDMFGELVRNLNEKIQGNLFDPGK